MSKARGYSLWLVPDNFNRQILDEFISNVSQTYKTPCFNSHLTLIGEILEPEASVVAKTETLVAKLSPLYANLKTIGQSNHFFMSLYLIAEQNKKLMVANEFAREIFMRQGDAPFFPHLSLAYGLSSKDAKLSIVSEFSSHLPLSVRLDNLQIMRSEGEAKDWYLVREFDLRN